MKVVLNEEAWRSAEIELFQTQEFQELSSVEKVLFAKWVKEGITLYLKHLSEREKRDPANPVH